MKIPHFLVLLDLNWFGVRAGLGYYDVANDTFRPAFVEFVIWHKWHVAFECGKTSRLGGGYRF